MKNKYFARTAKGYGALLVILAALLILSGIIAISLGAVDIPVADTIHVLAGKLARNESLYAELGKSAVAIVWNMRVPRVLLGGFVGAGLAVCGCVLQSTVNNPISEPYILGVSAGATFGATLFIVLGKNDDLPPHFIRDGGQCPFFCLFQFYYIGGRKFGQHHDDQILDDGFAGQCQMGRAGAARGGGFPQRNLPDDPIPGF